MKYYVENKTLMTLEIEKEDGSCIKVPDGVDAIGSDLRLFEGDCAYCLDLNNAMVVGRDALCERRNLLSLKFGRFINTIHMNAIADCKRLNKIIFPESTTDLGIAPYAFAGCNSVKKLTVPAKYLYYSALSDMTALKEVTIIDPTRIGSWIFKGSPVEKLTVIGGDMWHDKFTFVGADELKEIVVNDSDFYSTFEGCLYSYDYSKLISVPANIDSFTPHTNLSVISAYAFSGCKLETVDIPKGVCIEADAFNGCYTKVIIFDDGETDVLTEIKSHSFSSLNELKEIEIRTVVKAEEDSFFNSGCEDLDIVFTCEGGIDPCTARFIGTDNVERVYADRVDQFPPYLFSKYINNPNKEYVASITADELIEEMTNSLLNESIKRLISTGVVKDRNDFECVYRKGILDDFLYIDYLADLVEQIVRLSDEDLTEVIRNTLLNGLFKENFRDPLFRDGNDDVIIDRMLVYAGGLYTVNYDKRFRSKYGDTYSDCFDYSDKLNEVINNLIYYRFNNCLSIADLFNHFIDNPEYFIIDRETEIDVFE